MSESVNFIQGRKELYNPSEMLGGLFFSKDSKEILLNGESYGNATPADEEDITAESGNLKLKDRAYDEASFSGKGYVILRKNILEITVPKFDLTISSGCTTNGTITVTLGDSPTQVEVTTDASTPEAVAQLIQAAIPESTIEGAVVTFTSNPTLDYSTTGVAGSVADNSYQENRNILTLDMINEPNTIYEIRYDFDLNGATINIPEGCVLRFEGGSVNSGILLGNHTELLGGKFIFRESITVLGSFDLSFVLANWFKRDSDYLMFLSAVSFAKLCMQNIQLSWLTPSLMVKCICSTYTINNTIWIPVQVSLDGCGSTFVPSSSLLDKYMFYCNISLSNEESWDWKFPGNVKDSILNFYYSNPGSILTHLIKCGDSRRILNILVFRPAKLITYTGNYIDNKFISLIAGNMENTNFPLNATSTDTLGQTSKINIGLGDDCVILHISDGCSIFIGGGANAHINGAINLTISISGSRNIFIENIHNESGIIYLAESSAILKNCYFYAKDDGNIKQFVPYNKYSEVILENCQFGNILSLLSFSKGYAPILEDIKASFINCFALNNDGGGGHNNGNAIPLLYLGNYVNSLRFSVNLNRIVEDYLHLYNVDYNSRSLYYPDSTGSDAHVRFILLADVDRQLYFPVADYNADVSIPLPVYCNDFSWNESKTSLEGAILRVEIGKTELYTHYFDLGLIYKKKENIVISLLDNSYLLDSLPFLEITYLLQYTAITEYTRHEDTVIVKIQSNTLPDISLMKNGDIIITKLGMIYEVVDGKYIIINDNKWALIE